MAVMIFKPIETCNANCIYCNVISKNNQAKMDYQLLELVFERINEYLLKFEVEPMHFTWHGGEVCTLGEEFIEYAFELQERICAHTKQRIRHLVQSNLTLINQRYIDAFRRLGVDNIGTSYEPLPGFRGLGKKRNSTLYNQKFMEGINLLERNSIPWGAIYVVHKKSLGNGRKIFDFFSNLNPRRLPNFNMVHVFGRDDLDLAISGEQFAEFLGEIFPHYWQHRSRFGPVQPFDRFISAIANNEPVGLCEFSGKCARQWIYVGPDGTASQCGIAGDYSILQYGNIRDRSIEDILSDDQRIGLEERVSFLKGSSCKGCRFWGVCRGGCPSYAYLENGTLHSRSQDCGSVKKFISEYFEPITGLKCNLPPDSDQFA